MAVTDRAAGVVAEVGDTVSQAALPLLTVILAFGLALTATGCAAGDDPPAVAEKDRDVGLAVRVGAGLFTVKATDAVRAVPVAGVTVIVAL